MRALRVKLVWNLVKVNVEVSYVLFSFISFTVGGVEGDKKLIFCISTYQNDCFAYKVSLPHAMQVGP